jgi:hypothetical protein
MSALQALPAQIILLADNLKGNLQAAMDADTLEAARGNLTKALATADLINRIVCDAQLSADAEGAG